MKANKQITETVQEQVSQPKINTTNDHDTIEATHGPALAASPRSAEWDAFHDVMVDLMASKNIDDKTLLLPESLHAIFNQLPERIKATS